MKNLTTVLEYHDRTKHRPARYAASLGYMDWATQPDPFRRYAGSEPIPLGFSDATPPYHLLFENGSLPKAPLCIESLSQLLRYALGLAAWKRHGGSRWALRCNASSGNLHPTECYVIAPPIEGISDHTSLLHYAPREHALEKLHTFDAAIEGMGNNGFFVVLSSLIWREAWKYGERCWRYCQLDAGHAAEAIRVSARALGWTCTVIPSDSHALERLCGLDQRERFDPQEWESADMMLWISPETALPSPIWPALPLLASQANRLSPSHHDWPVLRIIDDATQGFYPGSTPPLGRSMKPKPSKSAGEIILKRRSAQMMDGTGITESQFRSLLDASRECPGTADVHFALFIHRVEGIQPGLYLYLRDAEDLESLRNALDPTFLWRDCGSNLYLLREGDCRGAAQMVSCNQEIARDGAFSFGMLCRFAPVLEHHGAIGYKHLYHQCGAIGQMLYLEATSLGLSATGIGCFLDDEFHALLGIGDLSYQSLYHFTIGRAIVDTRITTEPGY